MNPSNEVALMAMLVALVAMPGKTLVTPPRSHAARPDRGAEQQTPTPLQRAQKG